MEVALENGDAEGFIAYVDPDVGAAVEAAKGNFLGDGVEAECSLGGEDSFFEAFSCDSGFTGDEA